MIEYNLSTPIDFWFFVLSGILIVLMLMTRENKDSAVPMVAAIIMCNIVNFTYIKDCISTNIIEIILLEIVAGVASVLVVKIIDWLTAISNSFVVLIFEIVGSAALIYLFYNIRWIVHYITLIGR